MKMLCWVLALSMGLGASGCRSVTYIPLEELSEDEAARLESAEGLSVAGYRSDRGTTFKDRARAHRVAGGIRFTPDVTSRSFPGPVTVSQGQIRGVGRPRTDVGMTVGAIILFPVVIVAVILTAGHAIENNVKFKSW